MQRAPIPLLRMGSRRSLTGLAKNTSQVVLLFALVNLHRVRKKLMAIKERHEWGKFKAEVRLKTA